MHDPFGTQALRARVLDAWRASPARFREDANAEEDYALGGYRDRLVVELAQNAADAAARAGVPGRLELVLRDGVLAAANTGAPLDADGVASLSSLRASAKRDDRSAVGRFGVGFAAVLAVTDEPCVLSTSGGARWSRADTFALVEDLPALHPELGARGGHVPVLRLPFEAEGRPPEGYDTAVVLPLRDAAAGDVAARLLAELDPTLLLLLPGLAEVVVEVGGGRRVLRARPEGRDVVVEDDGVAVRWRLHRDRGDLLASLLADRPVEEQRNPTWSVTWAVPIDADGVPQPLPAGVPSVVRAPTPTDEPFSLPAVLAGSFPLDPSRRHVQPGPLTDALVVHAAEGFAELVRDLAPDPATLSLVPIGLAAGALDAAVREALLARLRETPFLPAERDPDVRMRPTDAVAIDYALVPALSGVLASVLAEGYVRGGAPGSAVGAALAALGVRRPSLAEVVESLAGLDREPTWWHELYAALDAAVPPGPARDALGALPVPLADDRLVVGPRGALVADIEVPDVFGLRVVHPDAAHPLLLGLGASRATPRGLLDEPVVRAAVEGSYDADDPQPVAEAVLTVVEQAGLGPGELPWLAELALPGADGEWYAAGELLVPGGRLVAVVTREAPFGTVAPDLVDRWGVDVLTAVGVLETFAVVREDDCLGPGHDLDGEDEWWAGLPEGAAVAELVAVRDLELVADWPAALRLLAEPPLRDAVVHPATLLLPDGRRVDVPSYTAWWLAGHDVLDGRRPALLHAGVTALAGLYDTAPATHLDPEFLHALGVLRSLDDVDPDDLLDRLADADRTVARDQLRVLHAWLAGRDVAPPAAVRAVRDGRLVVVPSDDAVVVDAPDLLPLVGGRAVVPVALPEAARLAESFDLPMASELAAYDVVSTGTERDGVVVHDQLLVRDADGAPARVAWRLVGGVLHVDAADTAWGRGRGEAWAAGEWSTRHARTEVLAQPQRVEQLADERDLD